MLVGFFGRIRLERSGPTRRISPAKAGRDAE